MGVFLDRNLIKTLCIWLNDPRRKPLVLRGARQVGKSTLVRMLAAATSTQLVELNLEQHSDLDAVFKTLDIAKIIAAIENRVRVDLPEKALLFLDEIQAAPHAFAALRYFYEQKRALPVIAAGSLLELMLGDASFSMPVGRVQYMHVGPLTFDEFLVAHNEQWFGEKLKSWTIGAPWPEDLHQHGLQLLRQYWLVGGMPEAVARHSENPADASWRSTQRQIVDTYREDFAKYSHRKALLPVIQQMYTRIPRIVGKKIKYSEIAPDVRHAYARDALRLLTDARIVQLATHVDGTGVPLGAEARPEITKAFWVDIGLLNRILGLDTVEQDLILTHSGPLNEQFISQHLAYWDGIETAPNLFYWLRDGRKGNAEVDFLLQAGSAIIPVEVKASTSGALRSLLQFLARGHSPFGMRFCTDKPQWHALKHNVLTPNGAVSVASQLLSLPHYMVCETKRLVHAALKLV